MTKLAKVIGINTYQISNKSPDTSSRKDHSSVKTSQLMSEHLISVSTNEDQQAFSELFNYFAPRIRIYFIRNGVDATKVEDLIQETFATIWVKADQYDHQRATASTWIFTIARNLRIDAFRREKYPEFDPLDPAFQPSQLGDGEQEMEVVEREKAIRIALSELSQDQYAILQLSYFEGHSYSEIAVRLGIPLGTVKSRARLAFGKLRSVLGKRREEL